MRSSGVEVPPRALDQHLALAQAVEDLAVEQFVPKSLSVRGAGM